jgi:NAD(P)-dependent dehydrogenase (short-subunit alcohol dehydrogenase family)
MSTVFEGKVAIVTGAAGEIGAVTARQFCEGGARLVAVDLDGRGLTTLTDALTRDGHDVLGLTADVSATADMAHVVDQARRAFGGVDILVNNAGVEGVVEPIESYPDDVFDRVMAINVKGVFLGMKHAVPAIQARGGGAIINLASVAGVSGSAGVCAYNASKHAVIGLTRSAAAQLGAVGIRVNAVCPAPVTGRMITSLETGFMPEDPAAARAAGEANNPMQRYAQPEEVANLVTYLAGPTASFLNGGAYMVDGGLTAKL